MRNALCGVLSMHVRNVDGGKDIQDMRELKGDHVQCCIENPGGKTLQQCIISIASFRLQNQIQTIQGAVAFSIQWHAHQRHEAVEQAVLSADWREGKYSALLQPLSSTPPSGLHAVLLIEE